MEHKAPLEGAIGLHIQGEGDSWWTLVGDTPPGGVKTCHGDVRQHPGSRESDEYGA